MNPLPDPTHDDASNGHATVSHGALGFELPSPAHVSALRAITLSLVVVVGVTAAFLYGYLPRRASRAALVHQSNEFRIAPLRIETVTPRLGASTRSLSLPGGVSPLEQITVYARANGYLHHWNVDIGAVVHADQALAEIDTPELDQEIVQARAQLAQADAAVLLAVANRDFARTDLARYRELVPSGYASHTDVDQRTAQSSVAEANVAVARAAVGAQRANLDRLQQLKGFTRVTAPFAGTITTRDVDRGALVTAGTTTLFTLAAMDPVRIFVPVPQDVAPSVRVGTHAGVTVREYPGVVFDGTITRTAGALDPASRTLNTEVRVPNPTGRILIGMYTQVALTLPLPHRVYVLPATAVFSDAGGVRVAVIDPGNTVHLVPVVIERDTGTVVEVSQGLTGSERVARIANPALLDGTRVTVVQPAPTH